MAQKINAIYYDPISLAFRFTKDFLRGFTMHGHGGHLDLIVTRIFLANFPSKKVSSWNLSFGRVISAKNMLK